MYPIIDTMIKSIEGSFIESSFISPDISPRRSKEVGMELLKLLLDSSFNNFESFQKHRKISYDSFYKMLLAGEVAGEFHNNFIDSSSRQLAKLYNDFLVKNVLISNKIAYLNDYLKVLEIYHGRDDFGVYNFRVYPKNTNSKNKALASHAKEVEEIVKDSYEEVNELLGSTVKKFSNSLDKIDTIKSVDGKASLKINNQKKDIVNALKVTMGNSEEQSNVKVNSVKAGSGAALFTPGINIGEGLSNEIIVTLKPSYTDQIFVSMESDKDVNILDVTPLKISYGSSGVIEEQEFDIPEGIKTISLTQNFELPSQLREYFDIKHLILLDNQEEWIRIKAINDDNFTDDYPELIIVGAQLDIDNVHYIVSSNPIKKFKYKAMFEKMKDIPNDVIQSYLSSLEKKPKTEVLNLDLLTSDEIYLEESPTAQPKFFRFTNVIYSDSSKEAPKIGILDGKSEIALPKLLNEYDKKSDWNIYLNDTLLTHVDSNPSEGEVSINKEGVLSFGDSASSQSVYAKAPKEKMNLFKLDSERGNYKGTVSNVISKIKGNTKLKYYEEVENENVSITLDDAVEVYTNIYKINLRYNYIDTIDNLAAYVVYGAILTNVTSQIFVTEKTFVNGKELNTHGDYAIDYVNGYLYINVSDSGFSGVKLEINADVDTKVLKEHTKWKYNFDDSKSLIIEDAVIFSKTATISKGERRFQISIDSDFNILPDTISIKGYRYEPEILNNKRVTDMTLLKESYSSGVSVFRLPFWPYNENYPISISTSGIGSQNGSSNKDWSIVDDQTIEVLDASNEVDRITLSYSFYNTNNKSYSREFAFNKSTNEIVLSNNAAEDLEIIYFVESYYLEYNAMEEIPASSFDFKTGEKKLVKTLFNNYMDQKIKNKELNLSEVVIDYEYSPTESFINSNLNQYVSLIPKYVDIQVRTR